MTVWRVDYAVGGTHEVLPVISGEFDIKESKPSESYIRKMIAEIHKTFPGRVFIFHYVEVTKL